FLVEVQLVRVHREHREQQVVGLRHGACDLRPVAVADGEVLVGASHAGTSSRNAASVRSTSSSDVCQFDTEIRIAGRPSQTVPLIHASPLACTAASAASVRSSSANRNSTWLSSTVFSTSAPITPSRAA